MWRVETPLKLIMLLKSMTDYDDDCAQDLDLVFGFVFAFPFLSIVRLGFVRDKF